MDKVLEHRPQHGSEEIAYAVEGDVQVFHWPNRKSGPFHMTVAYCMSTVQRDGEEVGEVVGCVGGGVEVGIKDGEHSYTYYISPLTLFTMAMQAHRSFLGDYGDQPYRKEDKNAQA